MAELNLKSTEKVILVICTANIFRSPVAEAFIRNALNALNLASSIQVVSAGMDARSGSRIPENLIEYIQGTHSIDLSLHRSQPLTFELFQNADLVLVMEQQHLERLSKQYPRQTRKIHYISELSGRVYDIIDPASHVNISLPQLVEDLKALISPNVLTMLKWLKLS